MPAVHQVASLLKRWLLGTHQGSVTPAHLNAYLDEFTFRFNRRHSRRRGLLFYRLLEHAVVTAPPGTDLHGARSAPTTYRPTVLRQLPHLEEIHEFEQPRNHVLPK